MVDLWLEETEDEWEEDLVEKCGPFLVVAGDQLGGQESSLESGDGMVADVTAWVHTLTRKGVENGIPVGGPG